jgi:DnaK suppressor protein
MMERKKFLERMEKVLFAKRAELTDLLDRVSKERPSEDAQVRDSADEAYTSSMNKIQTSLQEAEINEIKLVDDAIGRLKRGDYGICIDCGESVSDTRLEYYPYAARCIECQEAQE